MQMHMNIWHCILPHIYIYMTHNSKYNNLTCICSMKCNMSMHVSLCLLIWKFIHYCSMQNGLGQHVHCMCLSFSCIVTHYLLAHVMAYPTQNKLLSLIKHAILEMGLSVNTHSPSSAVVGLISNHCMCISFYICVYIYLYIYIFKQIHVYTYIHIYCCALSYQIACIY